jgi:transcriptional regulator with XRE-family HTH domain
MVKRPTTEAARRARDELVHGTLGTLVRDTRRAKKMRQEEVARALGEYQSFVTRIEQGTRRLGVAEFLELAALLDLDPVQTIRSLCDLLHEAEAKRISRSRSSKRAAAAGHL